MRSYPDPPKAMDASRNTLSASLGSQIPSPTTSPERLSGTTTQKAWMASDAEQLDMPENNMMLVMPSLCLCLFLASLDQTIISTATPYLAAKFGATASQYSWVQTAFMLANTIMTPMWGRLSDIVGRKNILYPGIIIFAFGSALCGASQSMNMLIGARAIQGIGGGMIMNLVNMIIGDIVPLAKRGAWSGFLEAVWAISSVLGPIIGGLLVQRSWRWIFFLNLPTCGVALLLLVVTLKLNARKALTWQEFLSTFDFLGLALIMSSCGMLVVAFSNAADNGWGSHITIALLATGLSLMVVGLIHCWTTKRNAIIPPRLMRTRTTVVCLICNIIVAMAFLSSVFYIPVFFQGVYGATPFMSAVYMLPFSICISIGTITAGQVNSRLKIVRPVMWVGYATAALGYGLFIKYFSYGGNLAAMVAVQVPAGLGAGWGLTVPFLIVQAAMPLKEMASCISACTLSQALGATLGIAIFQAVISSGLASRFPPLPGYGRDFGIPKSLDGYRTLHSLGGEEGMRALEAFSLSLRPLYIIWTAMFAGAFILSLFLRPYSLNRLPGQGKATASEEAEQGLPLSKEDVELNEVRQETTDDRCGEWTVNNDLDNTGVEA